VPATGHWRSLQAQAHKAGAGVCTQGPRRWHLLVSGLCCLFAPRGAWIFQRARSAASIASERPERPWPGGGLGFFKEPAARSAASIALEKLELELS
jgi:hypothetical protein